MAAGARIWRGGFTNGPTGEGEDDAVDQDTQGEETLEVEQNIFYRRRSLTILRWVKPFCIPRTA